MYKRRFLSLLVLVSIVTIIFVMPSMGRDEAEQYLDSSVNIENLNTVATVNVSSLNLRCGPGTEYDVIANLSKAQPLKVFGKKDDWYIVYDYSSGKIGAVNGYYITLVTADSMDDPKVPDDAPNTELSTPVPQLSDDIQRLLTLINHVREENGAGHLEYNEALGKAAYDKARDMVENNYFSHQSQTYGSPFEMMKAYGISFMAAGENIAGNQTVDGAFYAWLNSEGHKKNLLNGEYTETGIGIYTSPIYGKIIVQMFIRK